jgi:glycine cleavage system H protein
MAAALAACTFVLLIALDIWLRRREKRVPHEEPQLATQPIVVPEAPLTPEPVWVAGYELPEHLHYHPAHTWARALDQDTVTIGIDDFAAKLIGTARNLGLPRVGSWLLQGAKGITVDAEGRSAELLLPVEGEVVEVNAALLERPDLCTSDPYGRGWIAKLKTSHLGANLRNLLRGSLARKWTENAREQLEFELTALSGSVLRDGGDFTPGFSQHLTEEEWTRLVRRFLLT